MPGCFNADTLEGIADSLPGPYLFINPDEFNNPAEYLTAIRMRLPYKEVAALNQYGTHIEDILEAGYAQIKIEADSFEMFRNHSDALKRITTTHDFAEFSELIWACANKNFDKINPLTFLDVGFGHINYLYNYAVELPCLYKQMLLNYIRVQASYLLERAEIIQRFDYSQMICFQMARISAWELDYELADRYTKTALYYAYNKSDTWAQNIESLINTVMHFFPLKLKMKFYKFINSYIVESQTANSDSEYIWNLYNSPDTTARVRDHLLEDKYLLLLAELELITRADNAF